MKKKDLPAMPFYWGDWFKALDVQMLPRDVRCTWFEMLGRMWESKVRGELSINGIPPTDNQLSRLLGFGNDIEELKRHLKILERFSVFSRKKNGVIYSRKLVQMEEISRKRSNAGCLGMKSRYNKPVNKHVTNTEDEYETENEIKTNNINIIKYIISDLNEVTLSHYKQTKKHIELINARINEGHTIDDFKQVHRIKNKEWGRDDVMSKYLRPITLYSNKFNSYLNQKEKPKERKRMMPDID